MVKEARELAGKLRWVYGYSPTINLAAARMLDRMADELERRGDCDDQ